METTQDSGQLSGNVLFYTNPEPLSREQHGKLGVVRMDKPFKFAAQGHVVPLTVAEFPLACISYPIIFAGDQRQPLAVMGLSPGQNLFVESDGGFQIGSYVPAYIRRFPFVLANDEAQQRMIVCIECREADGSGLAGLQDRQVGDGDADAVGQLGQRHPSLQQHAVELDFDGHELRS